MFVKYFCSGALSRRLRLAPHRDDDDNEEREKKAEAKAKAVKST